MKITAGIRVKNGEPFAEECLRDLSEYVDEIVVFDNGSTDRTVDICRGFKKVSDIIVWERSFFHEGMDRNVVVAMAKNTNPDWILLPDIDEVFEDRMKPEIHRLVSQQEFVLFGFRFYHFWRSRTHYRVDGKWGEEIQRHAIARLVRNQPGLHYPVARPLDGAQISGVVGRCAVSDIRVKHYGHLHADLSLQKYHMYSAADPDHDYSHMIDETGLELEEWVE